METEDLLHYGKDWSGVLSPDPSAIAFPASTADVSLLLSECNARGIAVVPSGGRTGLSGGAVAAKRELVLSLSRMNQIGELDSRALTLEVQAGVITQAVHEHCSPHGLTWPVDFASKGSSHVGGNISTNAGGVRVIRYGLTRHWVLGLTVVTMAGEILQLNGALEKNNTGMDLRQIFIGTEGTLGVVTEATLKLTPLPKASQVCFFALASFKNVLELFERARKGDFILSAFECLSAACFNEVKRHAPDLRTPFQKYQEGAVPDTYVLMETDGGDLDSWLTQVFESGLVLDGVLAQSPQEQQELWSIRERVAESILLKSEVHQQDISVAIRNLEAFTADLSERYRLGYPEFEVFIFGHIGDGNLHVFIRKPQAMSSEEFHRKCEASDGDLFRFVENYHGSISAEHGIGVLKKPALSFSRSPVELEYFRKLKIAFDPKNLLNPGKIFD